MVQAFPTCEINMCNDPKTGFADNNYTSSIYNTGYICTIDVKYNDQLKQKTKKYPFFSGKGKG